MKLSARARRMQDFERTIGLAPTVAPAPAPSGPRAKPLSRSAEKWMRLHASRRLVLALEGALRARDGGTVTLTAEQVSAVAELLDTATGPFGTGARRP